MIAHTYQLTVLIGHHQSHSTYGTCNVTYQPDVEPCAECRVERLAQILPRDRRPVDAETRLDRCDVGTQCGAGCIVLRVFEESCVQLKSVTSLYIIQWQWQKQLRLGILARSQFTS